ncbi:TrkH family potassium uptake protein [Pikeienuella sp. HZG-20]|uniref:TrkH family potassium uptake protein n=1 Tax=Paludibacillus litoralis TaxID=3133267 RepID=UPI0030EE1770
MARSLREKLRRRASRTPPPAILAGLYLLVVLAGALLLKAPPSVVDAVSWPDAVFTSASAVTVTGLAVVDIGTTFTPFGLGVIALLIQLGGLGLMVFAVFVLAALGLPVGLGARAFLRDDLNQTSLADLMSLTRTILKVVLICEAGGAAALLPVFAPEYGLWPGFWHAAFHSISAFNNAGFSTFPQGLVPYALDPIVNSVIPLLIITGGIGYVVIADIWRRRRWRALSMHSKLMLAGTAALIVSSVVIFAALEWSNPRTLGPLGDPFAKLAVSWFQAVTTRTAGFNTTDIGGLKPSTTMMVISLMVIGGGPTSTAGGIKVTTIMVMLLATVAFFRRRTELSAFGRSIALPQILKVTALVSLSLIIIFLGVFLLTLSHQGAFLDIAFEVVSAFGTVGLSRGATGDLDGFGRAVIMLIMFVGRVGPLTLGFFLATQSQPRVRYPAGEVYLG